MTGRYLRHNLIDWFDQELIKKMSALVIGAGAVGNEVIKNLCLLGIGSVRIIDFDIIEVHNLTRSVLFTEEDVGKNKAIAAAVAASKLDPSCKIEAVAGDFWEKVDFAQFQEASVVFCCVDNYEARFRINRICNLLGVDLINAGIDSRYVSAEIYPLGRDPDSACYECNLPPSTYQHVAERYSCGWLRKVAFEEKKIPTTAITASFAGALASSLFLYSFREDSEPGAKRIFLDTVTGSSSKVGLNTNTSCVCCGTRPSAKILLHAPRDIGPQFSTLGEVPAGIAVRVSDPILVGWETPNCLSCSTIPFAPIFELASKYDESHTICEKCGLKQRLAVIRDQFTVGELTNLCSGKPLPGKYLEYQVGDTLVVVELHEGGANERSNHCHTDGRQDSEGRSVTPEHTDRGRCDSSCG